MRYKHWMKRDFSTWLVIPLWTSQVKRDDECAAEPIKGPRSPTGSCMYLPWAMTYLVRGTRKRAPRGQYQDSSIARWHFPISSPHSLAFSCAKSAPPSHIDCYKIRPDRGNFSIGGGFATELALLVVCCPSLVACRYAAAKMPHNKLYTLLKVYL